MKKTIKVDGITLLQMIRDEQIKNGTYINEIMKGYEEFPTKIIYCNDSLWYCDNEDRKDEDKEIRVSIILAEENIFEIIEEDEEPKEIEEIPIQVNREVKCKDKFIQSLFNHFYHMDLEVRNKINELTKAVNYLLEKEEKR